MTKTLGNLLDLYNTYVGQYALMVLLVPVGLMFTVWLRGIQVRRLWHALQIVMGKFDDPNDSGEVSHFQALCAALSATVGTGNIVGVALAIYYGGPGAVFWLWVTGAVGMATKFAEATLGQHFRQVFDDGTVAGGPMYYIERGTKKLFGRGARVLAVVFSVGTVLCSIGTGNMAQGNSMADAIHQFRIPIAGGVQMPHWGIGAVLAVLVGVVIIGGIKRIAGVAEKLVPFMALTYLIASLVVLGGHVERIPETFSLILSDAFTGTAATGGFIGSTFLIAARYGIARGLFSNEAGQGSAPIAHAAAKTRFPVREGLVALMGPLVDTLIICTLTALVIISTGTWKSGKIGAAMSYEAFETGLNIQVGGTNLGGIVVSVGLLLFAFTTTISWSYYGDRAVVHLLGRRYVLPYRLMFVAFVFIGAIAGKGLVWKFVDAVITVMAVPNLIALIVLAPLVAKLTREYFAVEHVPTK